MRRRHAIFAGLLLGCGSASFSAEFQSSNVGAHPVKAHLAAVQSEAASLRSKLAALAESAPERQDITRRISALEAQEKQLADELTSIEQQSRSPLITFSTPPTDLK